MSKIKIAGIMLFGIVALGAIGFGLSQTSVASAALEIPAGAITQTLAHFNGFGPGAGLSDYIDQATIDEVIAGALGITVEELDAARAEGQSVADLAEELGVDIADVNAAVQAAKEEALAAAVENGDITQAQADRLLAGGGRGGRLFGGLEVRGSHGFLTPEAQEAAIAEALGMTVDELEAARTEGQSLAEIAAAQDVDMADVRDAVEAAREQAIADAVASGEITQAQADALLSGEPLRLDFSSIFDSEAEQAAIADALGLTVEELEAAQAEGVHIFDLAAQQDVDMADVQAAVEAYRAEALQAAVDAGTITQAQADAILSQEGCLGGLGGFAGPGGPRGGHRHGGMRGGMPGFGFGLDTDLDSSAAPTSPSLFSFPSLNG